MPTSPSNRTIIAVTIGDPGGVGPEVILKSLVHPDIRRAAAGCAGGAVCFLCVGSLAVLEKARALTGVDVTFNRVASCDDQGLRSDQVNVLDIAVTSDFVVGKEARQNAELSLAAVELAAGWAKDNKVQAIVTAPINKEACDLVRPGFTGHTELLAAIDGTKEFAMMLTGGPLNVVLVTTHVPLALVPSKVTSKAVVSKIRLADAFFKRFMGVPRPRIGVAGLNPHAGEGGKMGREEIEVLVPAVQEAQALGIDARGPVPADVIFHKAYKREIDVVISMYHDQGLAPLKMIAFESGVNVTLGLSFIRTSPDHGTAFDIAYQNKAHPDSMVQAILLAMRMAAVKRT